MSDEHLLPAQNLEAEHGVLGSILLGGRDTFDDVATLVRAEDFYYPDHDRIFQSIGSLVAEGLPIDLITVSERLRRDQVFDLTSGSLYLAKLAESVPHTAHARYYADIVSQKAVSREVNAAAAAIIADERSNQLDAETLVERAETRIFAIGSGRRVHEAVPVQVAIDDSQQRLAERTDGVVRGLPTGLDDYDDLTGGLHPGHLAVLAARPSLGKTALGLNIAEHVTLEQQVPALFVSLEMTRGELGDRLLCGLAGVEKHRFLRVERLTDDDRERITAAADRLRTAPLFIDDAPSRTISEIGSMARRYRMRHGIGLLVVDYLQLVEGDSSGRGASRQEQIAQMSRRFKGIAKELDINVLVLSQLNRNAEGREDKRPHMADIRESGAVEQDANVVLLLHRPEFYDPDQMPGQAELIVAKNRDGQTGIVRLKFEKAITRFSTYHNVDPATF